MHATSSDACVVPVHAQTMPATGLASAPEAAPVASGGTPATTTHQVVAGVPSSFWTLIGTTFDDLWSAA